MRFAFTEEQRMLHDAVRDVLAGMCPPSVVREAWNGTPVAGGLWASMGDLGLPLAMADERFGGLGLDDVDLVGCFEASGAAALPLPLVETVAVAAPLLSQLGDESRLDRIGRGESVVTAVLDGSGLIPWAVGSDLITLDAGALWWLPAASAPADASIPSVDRARPLSATPSTPQSVDLLTRNPDLISRAWCRGVVGTSAQLVGLAGRVLAMTVAYVKDRQQFGVPVGSFQAVKHRLVDALVVLEMARPVVYAAAWSLAAGGDQSYRECAAAKAVASDAASTVAKAALQCHGAIGYTTDHDLHLYMKRIWALSASWGTAEHHRRILARELNLVDPH